MTLIAGFMNHECPILMGDLLTSNTSESDTEMVLPTLGRISSKHLSKGNYRPSNLRQKVNHLSPQLAIAWAGRKVYAQSFMRELIRVGLHNDPEREAILDVYNGICGQGDESIIGIYRNGKEMCLFGFNALAMEAPDEFSWFQAAGTGYLGLMSVMSNFDATVTSGQLNKLEKGIAAAVNIGTALLANEITTALPLQDLYGAGYEILRPLGSGLAKYTGLTYTFWRSEEKEPGEWRLQPFPFLATNYSYQGDILVIRSVRISPNVGVNSCRIDSDELHVVTPIYGPADYKKMVGYTPASLNSQRMCNIFLWRNCHGLTDAFATYGHYANQPPPLIWTNEFSKNEGIDINLEFVKASIIKIAMQGGSVTQQGD